MKIEQFRQCLDRQLSDVSFDERQRQAVLHRLSGKEQPMKKRMTFVLALICALMLVTVGALAASSLLKAPKADAVTRARQALETKYGFTPDVLGLFHESVQGKDGGWQVTFRSNGWAHESLTGEYVVTLQGDQASAAWTYDGVDAAAEGAPVIWGVKELEGFLQEGNDGGPYRQQNDLARQTAPSLPAVTPAPGEEAPMWKNLTAIQPEAQDLTQEAALALAKDALQEEYRFSQEALEKADVVEMTLYLRQGQRAWSIDLYLVNGSVEWTCDVWIDSLTHEILEVNGYTGGNG